MQVISCVVPQSDLCGIFTLDMALSCVSQPTRYRSPMAIKFDRRSTGFVSVSRGGTAVLEKV